MLSPFERLHSFRGCDNPGNSRSLRTSFRWSRRRWTEPTPGARISERRACELVGLSRTVLRYEPKAQPDNDRSQAKLIELAGEHDADLAILIAA